MPRYRVLKDGVVFNRIQWWGHAQYDPGEGCTLELDPDPVGISHRLNAATDEALEAENDKLFINTDDISQKQVLEADLTETRELLAVSLEEITALKAREPEPAVVEAEASAEPYVPDFTLIRDALAKFAEVDEHVYKRGRAAVRQVNGRRTVFDATIYAKCG